MVESCTVKVIKYILFIGCIVSLILFVMSGFWIASYPFGLDFSSNTRALSGKGRTFMAISIPIHTSSVIMLPYIP